MTRHIRTVQGGFQLFFDNGRAVTPVYKELIDALVVELFMNLIQNGYRIA